MEIRAIRLRSANVGVLDNGIGEMNVKMDVQNAIAKSLNFITLSQNLQDGTNKNYTLARGDMIMKNYLKNLDCDQKILITSISALISLMMIIVVYEKSIFHTILFSLTFTASISITVYQISIIKKMEIEK